MVEKVYYGSWKLVMYCSELLQGVMGGGFNSFFRLLGGFKLVELEEFLWGGLLKKLLEVVRELGGVFVIWF